MTEGNSATSLTAIEKVERVLRVTFPEAYRNFLLKVNGGRPDRQVFPITGMHLNPSGNINFFFGIDANISVYDLAATNQFYESRIPKGVVLIAENGMGDYVCLDLRDGRSQVSFWDNKHFWGTGQWREGDLYLVATSFESFLDDLHPFPS
jgi:hypothetical protein